MERYRRYLQGDEEAFAEIVAEYFDRLVFFIDRYVQDLPAAEDLAMDVFAGLIANPRRYNFRSSLKTYLFMVGRSRSLDYIKHRKKLQMKPLSEADRLPSDAPAPEELVLADSRKKALNAALTKLEEEMRLVVHLVYFEDLSCEEAAKVLKKNRKQIYNLLYRAKNALRAILEKEGMPL